MTNGNMNSINGLSERQRETYNGKESEVRVYV